MSNKYKPVLVVAGDPNSIFFEIFIKALKFKNYKSPIILIACEKLLYKKMHQFKFNKKIRIINIKDLKNLKLNNKYINLINTIYESNKKDYIKNSFKIAFKIIKSGLTKKMINGPINKEKFLKNRYLGITEYLGNKTKNLKDVVMLIYNQKLSVSPLTTHLPLKDVYKNITKSKIINHVKKIDFFSKKYLWVLKQIVYKLRRIQENILNHKLRIYY